MGEKARSSSSGRLIGPGLSLLSGRPQAGPVCVVVASLVLGLWPFHASGSFHLEEATIADIHRAILAKELTATELVGLYLKRIEAYNGQCVKGGTDAGGLVLGDVEPIEHAGKLGALMTLNIRGRRSKTDAADSAPDMPDARETARALDEDFARTGHLKGPLHGVVFAIKDQFDTFDMRSTSGAAAGYANDRPPRDAQVVARLRAAGAIILAKSNMGEYAAGTAAHMAGPPAIHTTRRAAQGVPAAARAPPSQPISSPAPWARRPGRRREIRPPTTASLALWRPTAL